MKKKRRKKISVHPRKRGIKHHVKLITLLASKIVIAFIAFLIGLYAGSFIADTFIVILIAFVFASIIYLLSILHIIKWLKI